MGKEEFLIKAKELEMSDADIEFAVKTVEEYVRQGLPPAWELFLVKSVYD